MKINIETLYEKSLKYSVYNVEDKKRKLICKGKFIKNASFDVTSGGKEIIVRISPCNIFKICLAAVYVAFMSLIFALTTFRGRSLMKTVYKFYPFEEIRITDTERSPVVEINYKKSPLYTKEKINGGNVTSQYLICNTHPYVRELSGYKNLNIILVLLELFLVVLIIALIVGIVLLVRLLIQ